MTGEKNRFSTHEKLWKLDDITLSTPKHDEMVLFLLNKKNATIISEVVEFFDNNTTWTHLDKRFENPSETIAPIDNLYNLNDFWNKLKNRVDIDLDIEYIINQKKDSEYVREPGCYKYYGTDLEKYRVSEEYKVDLIDWTSRVKILKEQIKEEYKEKWRRLSANYFESHSHTLKKDISIASEVPIQGSNHFIIGYWDIVISFNIPRVGNQDFDVWFGKEKELLLQETPLPIFIEVKPNIKSFGETLRQLKTYQTYDKKAIERTYLFTTDIRFKDAFESQGIKVLEYTDGV